MTGAPEPPPAVPGAQGRRRAGWVLVVGGAVLLALALIGAVLVLTEGDSADRPSGGSTGAGRLADALAAARPATAPFAGLTEARVQVGSSSLRVVVADSVEERGEGLRRRSDLGPYDGMLFVFPEPTTAGFTMSTVPVALDIGFYGSGGDRVSGLTMRPCAGTDAGCPVYRADGEFRYALETLEGRLPAGRLR